MKLTKFYPLNKQENFALVDCLTGNGIDELQNYLCADHKEGVGAKMVITPEGEPRTVIETCCEPFARIAFRQAIRIAPPTHF